MSASDTGARADRSRSLVVSSQLIIRLLTGEEISVPRKEVTLWVSDYVDIED
jgi:hypothetical protein